MEDGIELGRRPELVGGGLVRSMGGWSAVRSMRRDGLSEKGDERILGSGEFVLQLIEQADEKVRYQTAETDTSEIATEVISDICEKEEVAIRILRSGSRRRPLPEIRKKIAVKLVNQHGLSLAETARQLGLTTSAISQILRRNT